jgi:hypothetical protein
MDELKTNNTVVAVQGYQPGHIGIASDFLGRYREFDYCVARCLSPQGSSYQYYLGVDVCHNFNTMVRHVLQDPTFQWLWILGDDHLFNPNLLLNLLDRNVDVVTPLCLRRLAPYVPLLHTGFDKRCVSYKNPWEMIQGKTGLLEWEGSAGNAGMLIRRHVLEAMTDPYFENGKTASGVGAADLYFWHKLREQGFKTYLDLDNLLGHMTHVAVWPKYLEETGTWTYQMVAP